ncbi:hypothetical protein [Tsukamurella sp. 1534]|uniref:hypothetical protein n=1 Tax=Tsukamurella sp. 1534 TaxID=1151061 RepID=UPI0002D53B53|nr:hypothetical protein [Tsukamurella sp. 1534]
MSQVEYTAYVTAQTEWTREQVLEHVTDIIHRRENIPRGVDLRVRLSDADDDADTGTTTWRVHYTLSSARRFPEPPLPLSPDYTDGRPHS